MREKLLPVGIGLALVAVAVGFVLYSTRHNSVELKGQILHVRSQEIDPGNTIVILDFRISNPSTQQFVVREVSVSLEDRSGKVTTGDVASEVEAKRLFAYYPVLGEKFNPSLIYKDKLDSAGTMDRMIAARFAVSDDVFGTRKRLHLTIRDVDGPTVEILESR